MNKFIKGMFADYTTGKKILLLLGIFILLDVIGNVVGLGCDVVGAKLLSHANSLRLTQFVASMIVFVGTPCVFFYLTAKPQCSFREYFKLNKKNDSILYILAFVALLSITPIVNYTTLINEQMTLPDCLKEIEDLLKKMEDLAKEMTLELLKTDSRLTLIINLIVIAAAPAIGEELMFRGALQRTLHEKFSPFWAIVITSVLFSALHFQFYGFVPRFLLSVFLGMLYYFSGSIKLNMLVHFTNNALAVFVFYICTIANFPIDDAPTESLGKEDLSPVVIATVLFAGIMWAIYKIAGEDNREEMRPVEVDNVLEKQDNNQELHKSGESEDSNEEADHLS
jgi:membrane protease YdiL (CAAX protease family)